MNGMMMHFALGAALAGGMGRPVAYRYPVSDAGAGGRTLLQVENTGSSDVEVSVVQGLRCRRLGVIDALSVGSLTIPEDVVFDAADLRFAVRTVARGSPRVSDAIAVHAGDRVNLFVLPF